MGWMGDSAPSLAVQPRTPKGNTRWPWSKKLWTTRPTDVIPGIPIATKIQSMLSEMTSSTDSEDGDSKNKENREQKREMMQTSHLPLATGTGRATTLQEEQQRLRSTTKHPFAIVFSMDDDSLVSNHRFNSIVTGEENLFPNGNRTQESAHNTNNDNSGITSPTWNDSPSTILKSVVSQVLSCRCNRTADTTVDFDEAIRRNLCDDIYNISPRADAEQYPIPSTIAPNVTKNSSEPGFKLKGEPLVINVVIEHVNPIPKQCVQTQPKPQMDSTPKLSKGALVARYIQSRKEEESTRPEQNTNDSELDHRKLTMKEKDQGIGSNVTGDGEKSNVVVVVPPDSRNKEKREDDDEIRFKVSDRTTSVDIDRERRCMRGYEI